MAKRGSGKTKNPRTKKSAEAAKAAVPMRSPHEQIGVEDLKNLFRRCKSWKKQGSEITGQIGGAIANAAENKNLDKKAFSIVRGLANMTEQKRLTTLACLDYYIEVLELDKSIQVEANIPRQEAGEAETGGLRLAHDADAQPAQAAAG